MSEKETIERCRVECAAVAKACAAIIDRETEEVNLQDARCLIITALMRACGIRHLLSAGLNERAVSLSECIDVRNRVHDAFGAPGDWGGELCEALRRLYRIDLKPAPDEEGR